MKLLIALILSFASPAVGGECFLSPPMYGIKKITYTTNESGTSTCVQVNDEKGCHVGNLLEGITVGADTSGVNVIDFYLFKKSRDGHYYLSVVRNIGDALHENPYELYQIEFSHKLYCVEGKDEWDK
jgi:hypothetical protein